MFSDNKYTGLLKNKFTQKANNFYTLILLFSLNYSLNFKKHVSLNEASELLPNNCFQNSKLT